MLLVSDLVVSIEKKNIIDGLKFELADGQLVSIIGPNGAGKSTLLKVLAGVIKEYSGKISLDGDLVDQKKRKKWSQKIALLEQSPPLLSNLKASDLMQYARYPYMNFFRSLTKSESVEQERLFSLFELSGLKEQNLDSLSGGELQRVLLASIFFQDPNIILLDESLSFLDPRYKLDCLEHLNKWLQDGPNRLVLMVTHDLNEAITYSDQIIVLDRGKIEFLDRPSLLVEKNILKNIYQTDFTVMDNPPHGKFVFATRER